MLKQLVDWAESAPERWSRLHKTLLRIYTPCWARVEARDILVAWTAARLAVVNAKRELTRLESLHRLLTVGERHATGARRADMSFWGRAAQNMEAQVPTALASDTQAEELLVAFIRSRQAGRSAAA